MSADLFFKIDSILAAPLIDPTKTTLHAIQMVRGVLREAKAEIVRWETETKHFTPENCREGIYSLLRRAESVEADYEILCQQWVESQMRVSRLRGERDRAWEAVRQLEKRVSEFSANDKKNLDCWTAYPTDSAWPPGPYWASDGEHVWAIELVHPDGTWVQKNKVRYTIKWITRRRSDFIPPAPRNMREDPPPTVPIRWIALGKGLSAYQGSYWASDGIEVWAVERTEDGRWEEEEGRGRLIRWITRVLPGDSGVKPRGPFATD